MGIFGDDLGYTGLITALRRELFDFLLFWVGSNEAQSGSQRVLPTRNRPVQLARKTSEATTRSSQDIPVLLKTRGRW